MFLLVLFAVLVPVAVVSWFWGADSRPGFSDGRVDRVERWFPHSRTD
jgi:hypothetical protein